jgi:hypothetical protein
MKLLSHYTSEQGLVSIIRSQTLWATEFLSVNDKTEYLYALSAIYEAAYRGMLGRVPEDLRDPTKSENDIPKLISELRENIRNFVSGTDGYGSLYVTSFACGKNEDENDRGILTLWDRYTQKSGYCLQFDREKILRLIENEKRRYSYAWIELAEVKYGIDQTEREFLYLVEQMILRLLQHVAQERRDHRVLPDPNKIDVDSYFFPRLLSYCGQHKDPSFSDEREVRIFACPVDTTVSRVFTGFAVPKPIHRRRNQQKGARHLILGEATLPGLTPDRIVIGPNAPMDAYFIKSLYPSPPLISKSSIPIL